MQLIVPLDKEREVKHRDKALKLVVDASTAIAAIAEGETRWRL